MFAPLGKGVKEPISKDLVTKTKPCIYQIPDHTAGNVLKLSRKQLSSMPKRWNEGVLKNMAINHLGHAPVLLDSGTLIEINPI